MSASSRVQVESHSASAKAQSAWFLTKASEASDTRAESATRSSLSTRSTKAATDSPSDTSDSAKHSAWRVLRLLTYSAELESASWLIQAHAHAETSACGTAS